MDNLCYLRIGLDYSGCHKNKMTVPFNVLRIEHISPRKRTLEPLQRLTCDSRSLAKGTGPLVCAKNIAKARNP